MTCRSNHKRETICGRVVKRHLPTGPTVRREHPLVFGEYQFTESMIQQALTDYAGSDQSLEQVAEAMVAAAHEAIPSIHMIRKWLTAQQTYVRRDTNFSAIRVKQPSPLFVWRALMVMADQGMEPYYYQTFSVPSKILVPHWSWMALSMVDAQVWSKESVMVAARTVSTDVGLTPSAITFSAIRHHSALVSTSKADREKAGLGFTLAKPIAVALQQRSLEEKEKESEPATPDLQESKA